jgi:hypothetical protein
MYSLWNHIYWRIRPLFWDNPLFKTIDEWYNHQTEDGEEDGEASPAHYARFLKCWQFLGRYFASRGYLLYEYGPQRWTTYPPMQPEVPSVDVNV